MPGKDKPLPSRDIPRVIIYSLQAAIYLCSAIGKFFRAEDERISRGTSTPATGSQNDSDVPSSRDHRSDRTT